MSERNPRLPVIRIDAYAYRECKMRVLDKKGEIFGTMTPLKGLTFIYDEIYLNSADSDEVWCEFVEWADIFTAR